VPDIMGIVGGVDLVGQDEIGSGELAVAQREYSTSEAGHYWNAQFAKRDTERLVESRVRIGQDRFARQVLADYEHKCAFCGFEPVGFESSGMLVASHIKPWAKCESNGERLDRRNGVAACPMHDRAFDSGLITVNGGQRIHRTGELRVLLDRDEIARYFFGSQVIHERLLVPLGRPGPGKRYVDYHKEHVFRGQL
jgi:putative restriction endonuclease